MISKEHVRLCSSARARVCGFRVNICRLANEKTAVEPDFRSSLAAVLSLGKKIGSNSFLIAYFSTFLFKKTVLLFNITS